MKVTDDDQIDDTGEIALSRYVAAERNLLSSIELRTWIRCEAIKRASNRLLHNLLIFYDSIDLLKITQKYGALKISFHWALVQEYNRYVYQTPKKISK